MLTTSQKYWQRWLAWRDGSVNGRILRAMLVVGGGTFAVNLGAFVRELVVAYYFGASAELDAFYIAFLIPSFLITILADSLQTSFIPVYIEEVNKGKQGVINSLFSTTILYVAILMVAITGTVFILSEWLFPLLGNGFTEEQLSITLVLFYIVQPILIFRGLSVLWDGILNAHNRFFLTSIAPIFVYLIPVLALVVVGKSGGIYALAWGIVLGFMSQGVLLFISVHRSTQIRWARPQLSQAMKQVLKEHVPMIAGAFIMGGTTLVDQTMATAVGAGSVAMLLFGQRITSFILILCTKALSAVLLPNYAYMLATGHWAQIRQTLWQCFKWIILISVPIVILVITFSSQIVNLIFERGAFSAENTQIVSQVQSFYIIQLPFYLLGIVGVRLLNAMQKNHILMIISAVNLIINIVANHLFLQWWGLAGIALSTSAVYIISCIAIFYAIYYYTPQINPLSKL